ncbi:MAG: response regulator [Desulfomonile sp.]|nr:response regulator [Desulfomonile sp.]
MPESSPARVLIVDDEPTVLKLVCRMLEVEGYQCSTANSGEEAVALLQSSGFDAVITDIMMPGMSGIDLANVLRIAYPDTAVLIVTALADADTKQFVDQLDVDGHLVKPFTGEALRRNLALALTKRGKIETSQTKPADKSPASSEPEFGFDPIEFADSVRAGMSDAELMDKYRLTGGALHLFFEQLVSSGLLKRSDLDSRASLSVGTVMLDVPLPPPPPTETRKEKPVINARDAVECVRSGMDDVGIMKRYGISALGLRSLFLKLVDAGFLSVEEMYRYCAPKDPPSSSQAQRTAASRYLAVAAPIYEIEHPEVEGSVLEATEREVRVVGIQAEVGETNTFVIPAQRILQAEEIRFEAICVANDNPGPGSEKLSRFRITRISKRSQKGLTELVNSLALAE